VIETHRQLLAASGGLAGIRDSGGLDAAVAQPRMTFAGNDLYAGVIEKAAALSYSLISNHPFVDGNKRIGHAALEVTLLLNGYELDADVDEQEQVILGVASGTLSRSQFTDWIRTHTIPFRLGKP
jgi:death-on-curing protein